MSVFVPVSTLVRLVLWLAAAGILAGVLLGAQDPAPTPAAPAPATVVQPAAGRQVAPTAQDSSFR